jgi:hypothetical protein
VLRREKQLAAEQGAAARTLGGPAVASGAAFWQAGIAGGGHIPASGVGDGGGLGGAPLWYYDTRGDLQNLVYKSLYAGNMATYTRRDPLGVTAAGAARLSRVRASQRDGEVQQGNRYFHAALVLAERSRATPRVRLRDSIIRPVLLDTGAPQRTAAPLPAYIPLVSLSAGRAPTAPGQGGLPQAFGAQPGAPSWQQGSGAGGVGDDDVVGEGKGETVEQWVVRRTRELNMATRERPHDPGLWLQLAAFQDEVSRVMGRRWVPDSVLGACHDSEASQAYLWYYSGVLVGCLLPEFISRHKPCLYPTTRLKFTFEWYVWLDAGRGGAMPQQLPQMQRLWLRRRCPSWKGPWNTTQVCL